MASRHSLLLFCGLFVLALVQPALQGGVYVPAAAGIRPGTTGGGTGFFPGSAGGVSGGYKPGKAAVGGYGGGRGTGPGGLVPGGVGQGGLGGGIGQGGKGPKPGGTCSNAWLHLGGLFLIGCYSSHRGFNLLWQPFGASWVDPCRNFPHPYTSAGLA